MAIAFGPGVSTFAMTGSTSGVATIVTQAVAANPTLTLPTSSGYFALTTDPSGGGSASGMRSSIASYPNTVVNTNSGTSLTNTGTGTFNWTCPTGVTSVRATVVAGGGGESALGCGANAGGNGGFAVGIYTVVPGTVYSMTVGIGGAGATTSGGTATSGGSSSFSLFCSATGGAGATGATTGAAGSGTGGNLLNGRSGFSGFLIGVSLTSSILNVGSQNSWGGYDIPQSLTNAPVAWTINKNIAAGARGYQGGSGTTGAGGCSGAILLEWNQ